MLDTNNDGTISFDEFYTWWYYGKVNKLTELIQLKVSTQKFVSAAEHKLKKLNENFNEVFAKNTANGFFSVKLGEFAPKDTFGLKLILGQEAEKHSADILKGFEKIKDKIPSLVFKVKCVDPEKAKETLQGIIENVMVMAESFVPEEVA